MNKKTSGSPPFHVHHSERNLNKNHSRLPMFILSNHIYKFLPADNSDTSVPVCALY